MRSFAMLIAAACVTPAWAAPPDCTGFGGVPAEVDWDGVDGVDGCLAPGATVADTAIIGAGVKVGVATIGHAAVVGANTIVNDGALIAPLAEIGASNDLAAGMPIGRRSVIGDRNVFGPGSAVASKASVGSDNVFTGGLVVGYGAEIGSWIDVAGVTTVGNLATLGGPATGSAAVIDCAGGLRVGRMSRVAAGGTYALTATGDVRIGPGVTLGEGASLGMQVTLRRGATVGANLDAGSGVVIGRGVNVGSSVTIDPTVVIRASAKVCYGPVTEMVPRAFVDPLCLVAPTSGVTGWFRADDGVSTTGSLVDSWASVGSVTKALTGTGAARPTLIASDPNFNGRSSVDFSGASSQTLAGTGFPLGDLITETDYTVYAVFRTDTLGNSNALRPYSCQCPSIIAEEQAYFSVHVGSDALLGQAYTNAYTGAWSLGLTTSATFAYEMRTTGGTTYQHLSGQTPTTGSIQAIHTNGTSGNFNFGDIGNGNPFFDGQLAEVLFYDTSLSAADSLAVRDYLAARYAITW